MIDIIFYNFGFWFNIIIPVSLLAYLAFTNKEYIWKEFGIQVGASIAYIVIIYSLLFSVTTNLWDTEYINTSIAKIIYEEEWTEEETYTESYSCGSSKSPKTCSRTKTRRIFHPDNFYIKTYTGHQVSVKETYYNKAKRDFGDTKISSRNSGQVSWGDGRTYKSIPLKNIPISVPNIYENLVAVAEDSVIHQKVSKETINQLIKNKKLEPYPELYTGLYGETLLNRYTNKTNIYSNMLNDLNKISSRVGPLKQANPIIYITDQDRSFKYALSHHWGMGKKNDIILVLGIDSKGDVNWSDVICFTNNTDFIVDMQSKFKGLSIVSDSDKILNILESNILKGYKRKPMEEFDYLKENITLEWYWNLLIILGSLVLNGFLAYRFLKN